jgi:dihydroorotase
MLLIPGVIDDQVHFRERGWTLKATFIRIQIRMPEVLLFMEMQNMFSDVTVELLEEKYKRASDVSLANYSFYIGATNNNLDEVLNTNPSQVCGIKCFMGSSTGNMLVEGTGLEDLFKNAHMLIATHNEEESIIKAT